MGWIPEFLPSDKRTRRETPGGDLGGGGSVTYTRFFPVTFSPILFLLVPLKKIF